MRTMLSLAALLAFAGCYQQYYVADVHSSGEGLVQTKCAFDAQGRATDLCHDELVDGDSDAYPADDAYEGTPDPAQIRAVKRELDRPRAARPAPDDHAIATAVASSGVPRLLELCRRTYAADLPALQFGITVAPTGAITDVEPHAVSGAFATCADQALRTASFTPYDGAPVHSEQTVVL
jgi:hypothetical protein